MPRPVLRTPQKNQYQEERLHTSGNDRQQRQQQHEMDKMKLDRLLRRPRSKKYMEALCGLDVGGHVHNQAKMDEIIETIRNEFPEDALFGSLMGYVSICNLDPPYEVHTLDLEGRIIEHYKAGEIMPDGLEKARGIAIRGGYSFIEVYIDCCRAVSSDGTVSVISC